MNLNFSLLDDLKKSILKYLPTAIGVLLFIIICWILLRLILFVVKRFLKVSRIQYINIKLNENELFLSANIKVNLEKIILKFIKWLLVRV